MQKILDKYLLPLAMIVGFIFYKQLKVLSPATPFLLAIMLLISYSRIDWREIKFTKAHIILLAIQYLGSIAVYITLKPINPILAQGAMICIFAPTATAAPVVVGLLGGNIGSAATFTLFSNLSTAFMAPIYFTLMSSNTTDIHFLYSFLFILKRVLPVLVLPFLLALLFKSRIPKLHNKLQTSQIFSYYIWGLALAIVIANMVYFVIQEGNNNFRLEVMLAITSFIIAITQFAVGRKVGSKFNITVTGGQGLGQKNTILAVWLTQTYLHPIASLGPGFYILWQNLINSYQIWKKRQKTIDKKPHTDSHN